MTNKEQKALFNEILNCIANEITREICFPYSLHQEFKLINGKEATFMRALYNLAINDVAEYLEYVLEEYPTYAEARNEINRRFWNEGIYADSYEDMYEEGFEDLKEKYFVACTDEDEEDNFAVA